MKIKEISIKNYRGIKELNLKFENLTVLIGKNGVGKSSILHALNFFKEQKYKLKIEDFYNKDLKNNIEVSITFFELNDGEKTEFQSYIHSDELKIIKIAEGDEKTNTPNISQKYHGQRLLHRPFKKIRDQTKATQKKNLYNELRKEEMYSSLPSVTRGDQIESHLTEWESNHPEELEIINDDGQFFGWTAVGAGKLGKFMEFFFIPAVHEYSEEEIAEKSTYLNEILDLTIRKTSIESTTINEFKKQVENKYKKLVDKEAEPGTIDLSKRLSERLNQFAPGCEVFINYQPGDVRFTDTKYSTELKEFGFQGPISFLGHGVQRSFFFMLLQYLGEQRTLSKIQNDNNNSTSSEKGKLLILLIIEEPELYLHPNRIRMIKKLFQDLSKNDSDSPFQFQIICSSHSPYLIDILNVEDIRILRKKKINNEFNVFIKQVDLNNVAQKIRDFWELPKKIKCDATTLTSRLISVLTLEVSEGFFADKIVLVEGLEDKAVLLALNQYLGTNNFDQLGITIIPVLGKRNLDRLALIFKDLSIPIFIIFDTDSDKRGEDLKSHKKINIVLRKIMDDNDIKNPFAQKIERNWASLNPNMTKLIKGVIGNDFYDAEMKNLKESYGFTRVKNCKKNYKVMEDFIRKCYEGGKKIQILEKIIQNIYDF
ncbi:MAG: ATP-dependent nuclease [Promethearchaeota archaeon]